MYRQNSLQHTPEDVKHLSSPIDRTVVLDLLIEQALTQANPEYGLHLIQSDARFREARAQREFCETLCLVERRHFEKLVNFGEYTPEFRGALENSGDIFSQFNQNQIPPESITTWLNLISEELRYLKSIESWSDLEKQLAIHVFKLTARLTIYAPDVWRSGEANVTGIFSMLSNVPEHIFDSKSPDTLPDELESETFTGWLELCAYSENPLLLEQVINEFSFVYNTWYNLTIIMDEDEDEDEDEPFDPLLPEANGTNEDEEESFHYPIDELQQWESESNSGSVEGHDADSTWDREPGDVHSIIEGERWEDALSLVMYVAHGSVDFDNEYLQVLHNADLGTDLWQSAFDGVLLSSLKESKEVVSGLVQQFPTESRTVVHLVSLLDAPIRLTEELYFDPTELLTSQLATLPKTDRHRILRAMREYISEQSPLLDDAHQMDLALNRLMSSLRKPRK